MLAESQVVSYTPDYSMRISAQKLLEHSTEELHEILDGHFTLVFPDGEIQTNARETLYCSYAWDLLREFRGLAPSRRHHLKSVLGNGSLSASTNGKMLAAIVWDIYYKYVDSKPYGYNIHQFRGFLAKRATEVVNKLYNHLTLVTEAYMVTLKIEDFIEAMEYPPIKEAYEKVTPFESSIENLYSTIKGALMNDEALKENMLARMIRSSLIDANQLNQCIGVRGFITDMNSSLFRKPILSNLVDGICGFYESIIESRSAAKALAYSEEPLEQAEYFSRRLQLIGQSVRNLIPGDCGSTHYLSWRVQEQDLKNIAGKYIVDEQTNQLRAVTADDIMLVGKMIRMRSVIGCKTEDPYGVCETCFGQLSLSVFEDTNIGQLCVTTMTRIVTQKVLSTKHLDGSSVVELINVGPEMEPYLRSNKEGNGYMLNPAKGGKKFKLIIAPAHAPGFTDIMEVGSVDDLNPNRTTSMDSVGFIDESTGEIIRGSLAVGLPRRPASFTLKMLRYIRKTGWTVDEHQNYVVDLSGWDPKDLMMTIPLRHYNMGDFSKDIASLLESRAEQAAFRDNEQSIVGYVSELYELVNSRLSVNLAVLEIVAYGTMIQSDEENNYALPKPGTKWGIGVMTRTIMRRSLSAALAFEDHRLTLTDPSGFIYTNRLDHPMDVIIDPRSVIEYVYGPDFT